MRITDLIGKIVPSALWQGRTAKPVRPSPQDVAPPPARLEETIVYPCKTKLDIARDQLKTIDEQIAARLTHFRAAANPDINPTADMIARVKFPKDITNMAIEQNTPVELFAGVSLFLSLRSGDKGVIASRRMDHGADKTEEFKHLCLLLCSRHNASRLVVEHKQENREEFMGADGKVITFVPEQHDRVVARMAYFSEACHSGDGALSGNIIGWVAAVNAGWQDMAINENDGPFIAAVTAEKTFEIRDPRPSQATLG